MQVYPRNDNERREGGRDARCWDLWSLVRERGGSLQTDK